jgi:hypothetical protein
MASEQQPQPRWERVAKGDDFAATDRLLVPGGRLYRVKGPDHMGLCFVPDLAASAARERDTRRAAR